MTALKKTSTRKSSVLLAGGNTGVELYIIQEQNLQFVKSVIQNTEWGVGSMISKRNNVYLINGDTDKIYKYHLGDMDLKFELLYETEQKFSWPLLNCFVVYKDSFATEFIIGIHNENNFKNILVEMVLPKKTTRQFKVFEGLHDKTICNVVYNKKRNIFASGGRDNCIHLWLSLIHI